MLISEKSEIKTSPISWSQSIIHNPVIHNNNQAWLSHLISNQAIRWKYHSRIAISLRPDAVRSYLIFIWLITAIINDFFFMDNYFTKEDVFMARNCSITTPLSAFNASIMYILITPLFCLPLNCNRCGTEFRLQVAWIIGTVSELGGLCIRWWACRDL